MNNFVRLFEETPERPLSDCTIASIGSYPALVPIETAIAEFKWLINKKRNENEESAYRVIRAFLISVTCSKEISDLEERHAKY